MRAAFLAIYGLGVLTLVVLSLQVRAQHGCMLLDYDWKRRDGCDANATPLRR